MDSKLIGLSIEGYAGLGLIIIVSVYLSYSEAQIPREEPMCLCFHGIWHRRASPLFCKMDLSSSWNESKKKKEKKKKKRSFQYKASRLKMVEESLSCLKFSCFQRGWWVCFFYTTAIFQIFIHQYFYQYY